MNPSRKDISRAWLPALIWLAIIAVESTSFFSADNTGRWMYPFFHSVFGLDLVRFGVWHHYLRKTGHFVGYFTLSILLFRAWRATLPASTDFEFEVRRNWSFRWARISVLMTILVACADEWHQSYIPSRTGSIRDVWLDGTAGLVAQIVVFVWLKMRGRKAEHSTALRLSHPAAPGDD